MPRSQEKVDTVGGPMVPVELDSFGVVRIVFGDSGNGTG